MILERSAELPTDTLLGVRDTSLSSLLRFLLDAAAHGKRGALVTVTDVIGSGPRRPGTHMVVIENGDHLGSVSNGCVDAAVIAEALRSIESGRAKIVRIGQGSRFIDLRLPCGGGMDLLFTPTPARGVLEEALRRHEERRALALALSREGSVSLDADEMVVTGWRDGVFLVAHAPRLKLFIIGRGAEARWLARLALVSGVEVCVASPDQSLVDAARSAGAEGHHLQKAFSDLGFTVDTKTAVVLLFHDHDWELDLLEQALLRPAFFVGAMGSMRSHAARVEGMRARGIDQAAISRIVGPVGLIPSARDPQTLALSVLAQVVSCYSHSLNLDKAPTAPATGRKAVLAADGL